jgi:hypothetical protein
VHRGVALIVGETIKGSSGRIGNCQDTILVDGSTARPSFTAARCGKCLSRNNYQALVTLFTKHMRCLNARIEDSVE